MPKWAYHYAHIIRTHVKKGGLYTVKQFIQEYTNNTIITKLLPSNGNTNYTVLRPAASQNDLQASTNVISGLS